MRLCVQNGGLFERCSIEETYRIISRAGFDSVDYNMDNALTASEIRSGVRTEWFTGKEDDLYRFIGPAYDAIIRNGLVVNQIHAPFPAYTGNEEMDRYVLDALKMTMKGASFMDCRYAVVHEGFPPFEWRMAKKDIREWNIRFYSELIEEASRNNVIICLENLFSNYSRHGSVKSYGGECADMDEAASYIEELNGIAGEERFGFCLDIGHANLMGKRIYDAIMRIAPYLKVLHVHDNNGLSDQHLFPYNGNIIWEDFTDGIRDSGYKGAISFETFAQVFTCDKDLIQDEMNLLGAIGRLFINRIEGEEAK